MGPIVPRESAMTDITIAGAAATPSVRRARSVVTTCGRETNIVFSMGIVEGDYRARVVLFASLTGIGNERVFLEGPL